MFFLWENKINKKLQKSPTAGRCVPYIFASIYICLLAQTRAEFVSAWFGFYKASSPLLITSLGWGKASQVCSDAFTFTKKSDEYVRWIKRLNRRRSNKIAPTYVGWTDESLFPIPFYAFAFFVWQQNARNRVFFDCIDYGSRKIWWDACYQLHRTK